MTEVSKQEGVMTVLLERFANHRLPRALDIKAKVDRGETLNEIDMDHLEDIMKGAQEAKPYIDQKPELQELYTRAISLYNEITKKALENEQNT